MCADCPSKWQITACRAGFKAKRVSVDPGRHQFALASQSLCHSEYCRRVEATAHLTGERPHGSTLPSNDILEKSAVMLDILLLTLVAQLRAEVWSPISLDPWPSGVHRHPLRRRESENVSPESLVERDEVIGKMLGDQALVQLGLDPG
jgi:hypothetical protein